MQAEIQCLANDAMVHRGIGDDGYGIEIRTLLHHVVEIGERRWPRSEKFLGFISSHIQVFLPDIAECHRVYAVEGASQQFTHAVEMACAHSTTSDQGELDPVHACVLSR